ncbi:ser/thr phosphatase family protein (macronuclear) [Tetrahymena thermophila SB210]|uniref:Sphingomyelin phosphodiesterase n=1 Tax=Tetrahymena thermophila (strain SB210) TaxID=312017 RepID=Q22W64_TETTS|nr:ser/thr phosphatase family protein [Tetrahymena thermophila SB210]EAR89553.1 ser/thr phosphatase family protein [Tetrahymena thermophila SB210]|eukprot:XP_001009798.1 ser/thr phosphatase family protein [Tetrahymena thermophila SB210]
MKLVFCLSLILLISAAYAYQSKKEYDILMSNFAYQARDDKNLMQSVQFFMESYFGGSSDSNSTNSNQKDNTSLLCKGCKLFFNLLQEIDQPLVRALEKLLNDVATKECLVSYHYTEDVCRQYAQEMSPFIVESIQQHFFDPDYACPFIKVCPKVYEDIDIDALVYDIIKEKPKITQIKQSSGKTLKVLQLADVHIDLEYQEGFPTTCNYPICCRNNTFTLNKEDRFLQQGELSGYWGTLGICDLPLRTFDQFVQFVKKNLTDIDLVIWTGDNVGHDEENSEINRNFNITKLVTEKLRENWNFTVIGSYGNNDAAPDYIYEFQGNLDSKLQRDTAEIWKQWLDEKAQQTLSQHGYFATRVPHLPNLKIISLNTFACTEKNYVLLRDSTDPGKQLQWLNQELSESEEKGENVYILGHIPNNFCSENWGKVYKALAERYQSIIKAQLFGHTHSDYFTLQRSALNVNETIGVQLITPSLTPNYKKNPSFRVYHVDAETYEVLDFDQYRLNLTKYNELGASAQNLEWDLQYSFKQTYNLTDMSLQSLDNLAQYLTSKNDVYDLMNMNYLTLYQAPSDYTQNLLCLSTQALTEEFTKCQGQIPYSGIEQKVFHMIEKNWRRKIDQNN